MASKAPMEATTGPACDSELVENTRPKRLHEESELAEYDLVTSKKTFLRDSSPESSSELVKTLGTLHFIADAHGVPGLRYYPNFVTKEEERDLMLAIDASEWDTTLKRRVQHFGLRYDYTAKSVDKNAAIEPLPSFTSGVVSRLSNEDVFPSNPDQLIVNEYEPGQGISGHIDRVDSFGPVVASLSLGSTVIMSFSYGQKIVDVLLERRSMAVLTGDARFKWKHSIAARKADVWKGTKMPRGRRVSMTFRTVKREATGPASSSASAQW